MLEACRKVLRIEERRKPNIKDWDRTLGNHPEVMNLNSEEREELREGLLQLERGLGSSSEVLNQAATQERIDDDFPPFVTDRDLNNFE